MKHQIAESIKQALKRLQIPVIEPHIERTRHETHGDYACNIAMQLAKSLGKNPREIAEAIKEALEKSDIIQEVKVAGPGFINFYLTHQAYETLLRDILKSKEKYGRSQLGEGKKIHIELVSANPTGPLHVGHGRGAAVGASLADLLKAVGFEVHREYYVNDVGRQMHILALSVWLRYLEYCQETIPFPSNAYLGDYVKGIAKEIYDQCGKRFYQAQARVFENIPADENEFEPGVGDKEAHVDALIKRAQMLLSSEDYQFIFDYGLQDILTGIKKDLKDFNVTCDEWFSERVLHDQGLIQKAIDKLIQLNHAYQKDGAWWFRSTEFGDDKDRVLIREDGRPTYFASDIAYHDYKFSRGFDCVINLFGADHHGYVIRLQSAIKALGWEDRSLVIPLVQFAVLYRGKEKISMSTRKGSFVTLRELYEEVGTDAARFFYVMRKPEQHMDFDLELAKSQTADNPVYYIQYAHARIASVFRQLQEKDWEWKSEEGLEHFDMLTETHENTLIKKLSRYEELLEVAAQNYDPHSIAHYLQDLANDFHSYYNAHPFLIQDHALRNARLNLVKATQQIIANGLEILGVRAPERM